MSVFKYFIIVNRIYIILLYVFYINFKNFYYLSQVQIVLLGRDGNYILFIIEIMIYCIFFFFLGCFILPFAFGNKYMYNCE